MNYELVIMNYYRLLRLLPVPSLQAKRSNSEISANCYMMMSFSVHSPQRRCERSEAVYNII